MPDTVGTAVMNSLVDGCGPKGLTSMNSGMGMTFILYKTTDSNDGNWGVEIMYNYFFDQLNEGLEYILP